MPDKAQKPAVSVLERLLLSKELLSPLRYAAASHPNHPTLATHILTSHNAAELALAGIAQHLGRFPNDPQVYLMNFFPEIKKEHPDQEVEGKEYFNQLNRVRINIKHHGIFPDPQQWKHVAEKTYDYISSWCKKYVGHSLDELDEASLIANAEVKRLFYLAKESYSKQAFRDALELIAKAEFILFEDSPLSGLKVGKSKAEDALKVSAFGVNANDFLTLQEFLPEATMQRDGKLKVKWRQLEYGHPANWRNDSVDFSLRMFLSLALRIQNAQVNPVAIKFSIVYTYEITALRDGVELFQEGPGGLLNTIVKSLQKGETMRGFIKHRKSKATSLANLLEQEQENASYWFFVGTEEDLWGLILKTDVSVKCVPLKTQFVDDYFPNLPEIEADEAEIK